METNRTIFISYRRDVGSFIARAIYLNLKEFGYEVFLDVESINNGKFEPILLKQIKAHAHFLIILTFGTLDRCLDPEDWVRREIETAMDNGRNIIPLLIEGYSFKDAEPFLVDKLQTLAQYNALEVPHTFFEEAMNRLRDRYLKLSQAIEITPMTTAEIAVIQDSIDAISKQPEPTKEELQSEALLIEAMRRLQEGQVEKALELLEQSIRTNPRYHKAHYNRGIIYSNQKRYDGALAEYNRALYLEPLYTKAYINRGVVFSSLRCYEAALADFNIALEQAPEHSLGLSNRLLALKALSRLKIDLWLDGNCLLAIVADGSDDAIGAEASYIAVESIRAKLVNETHLKLSDYQNITASDLATILVDAIRDANKNIFELASSKAELKGMTTALTLAFIRSQELILAHVGDSRAYRVDISDGSIYQLTEDHSLVQALLDAGHISEAEAQVHPMKNVLYRALGQNADIDVDIYSDFEVQKGDRIILCSKELSRHLNATEIAEIAVQFDTTDSITKELIKLANAQGGPENLSVIVIIVGRLSGNETTTDFNFAEDDPTTPLGSTYG